MVDLGTEFLNKMGYKYCNRELQIILMRTLPLIFELIKFLETHKKLSDDNRQVIEMLYESPIYFYKFLKNSTLDENNIFINPGYEHLNEQLRIIERRTQDYKKSIFNELDKIKMLKLPKNVEECVFSDIYDFLNQIFYRNEKYYR